MAEYIDRDKVLDAVFELPPKMDAQGYGWIARGGLYQLLRDFPSADVQPVVRCINCKYYEGLACCKLIGDCGGTNWFCGWGEPRDET